MKKTVQTAHNDADKVMNKATNNDVEKKSEIRQETYDDVDKVINKVESNEEIDERSNDKINHLKEKLTEKT